jgi:hypothetical protein
MSLATKTSYASRAAIPSHVTVVSSQGVPQRGYVLQPRVAASATLGKRMICPQPQRGCGRLVQVLVENGRNRVAVGNSLITSSQGSRSGNPGLEDVAPLGQ